jgi:hypothetical protein
MSANVAPVHPTQTIQLTVADQQLYGWRLPYSSGVEHPACDLPPASFLRKSLKRELIASSVQRIYIDFH